MAKLWPTRMFSICFLHLRRYWGILFWSKRLALRQVVLSSPSVMIKLESVCFYRNGKLTFFFSKGDEFALCNSYVFFFSTVSSIYRNLNSSLQHISAAFPVFTHFVWRLQLLLSGHPSFSEQEEQKSPWDLKRKTDRCFLN